MRPVEEDRKSALTTEASTLAEKLGAGGDGQINRNILRSACDEFMMGVSDSAHLSKLLNALTSQGNPIHKRSKKTRAQFERLKEVLSPFLTRKDLSDSERRWILGWTGRLLEIKRQLNVPSRDNRANRNPNKRRQFQSRRRQ